MNRYLAITPAKDEEKHLPALIDSLANQSVRPARWIIIDDGSKDATASIIDRAAQLHPWIEPHHLAPKVRREEGGESVIMQFLPRQTWEQYDYIFRLDADLSFGPELLEGLMAEFVRHPSLGIAGPTLYEPKGEEWLEIVAPGFHTRGAAKLYSRACFTAIGGLENGPGWDTLDEVRAMMLRFTSRSFRHLRAFHHRPQGGAAGLCKSRIATGRVAYRIGYSPLFMIARAVRRTFEPPYLMGGALMLVGYLQGYWKKKRISSPELVRFVRRQQMRRLLRMESQWR